MIEMCTHIPDKPLQDCNYMQKKFTKEPFYARMKVPIVKSFYIRYSKLYYALLDLKKVVIFPCFNVTIYIEFELLNY